ncbi:MAG: F0F1 ATP synthase subunit epsilon [Verrucomicrobia bacterium]|nr:F0F1 ATP synthase subunit epsilon [Verrucomicrobiota bacterium]
MGEGREIQLTVTTPTRVIVDEPVRSVQAEDASGRFGIEPGHERFLTTTVPSLVIYRPARGGERYLAVDHGTLRVTPDRVQLATRQAVASDDLDELARIVEEVFSRQGEAHRRTGQSFAEIELSAWRKLMEYEERRAKT